MDYRNRTGIVLRAATLLCAAMLVPLIALADGSTQTDGSTQANGGAQANGGEDVAAGQLAEVVVQATLMKEKDPYLTGGDVQVITREQIELNHYATVQDAIAHIPGVQIASPGYHGQEYGTTFNTEVSINGDAGVLILVNGRRIGNSASSFGGAEDESLSAIGLTTSIDDIERIEVIKGTGGAAYGADASGGIINIITRQGHDRQETTIDAGAGSWGHQRYGLTQSGPITDESFRYFLSGSYEGSQDTKYKDYVTGDTLTYADTRYHDAGASARLDKDLTATQSLSLYYTWSHSKDHYPITAPDSNTLNLFYNSELPSSSTAPGYRNWFLYDASLGSYNEDGLNDVDLKYTFDNTGGAESFVRIYRNYDIYQTVDYAGLFGTQLDKITPALIAKALNTAGTNRHERENGGEVQLAHKLGINTLMFGLNYGAGQFDQINVARNTRTLVNRNSYSGFLQDKIDVTSRWIITPGILYSEYSTVDDTAANGNVTHHGNAVATTGALHSNYTFDLIGDFYVSWQQIFRPVTNADYASETTIQLHNEKGNAYEAGIRKNIANKTFLSVNYQLTDMSNAIGRYSIFNPTAVNAASVTGYGAFVNESVNATQEKRSLNLLASEQITRHWAVAASYSYIMDQFAAKGYALDPIQGTNVNALINEFRPPNTYQADVVFGAGPFSVTLNGALYTGNDTAYFSDKRFAVFGFVANYDLFKKTRLYVTVDNLTNEAWQNKASASYGPGAFPQPARSFFIGVHQRL